MSFCIKCGSELLPNAKYCHKCGSEAVTVKKSEKHLEATPYESPMAETYYEILRPVAEEKMEESSVKHRKDVVKPFSKKEKS